LANVDFRAIDIDPIISYHREHPYEYTARVLAVPVRSLDEREW